MDGMVRKEVDFPPCRVRRLEEIAFKQDQGINIRAYVVSGRDVLKVWNKISTVVVLLPDDRYACCYHSLLISND